MRNLTDAEWKARQWQLMLKTFLSPPPPPPPEELPVLWLKPLPKDEQKKRGDR